jgi:hypothetical protein
MLQNFIIFFERITRLIGAKTGCGPLSQKIYAYALVQFGQQLILGQFLCSARGRAFVRSARERRDWAVAHQRRLLLFLFYFYFLLLFLKVF